MSLPPNDQPSPLNPQPVCSYSEPAPPPMPVHPCCRVFRIEAVVNRRNLLAALQQSAAVVAGLDALFVSLLVGPCNREN